MLGNNGTWMRNVTAAYVRSQQLTRITRPAMGRTSNPLSGGLILKNGGSRRDAFWSYAHCRGSSC